MAEKRTPRATENGQQSEPQPPDAEERRCGAASPDGKRRCRLPPGHEEKSCRGRMWEITADDLDGRCASCGRLEPAGAGTDGLCTKCRAREEREHARQRRAKQE